MDIVDAVLKEIKEPHGCPTDVIGFDSVGRSIADALSPIVGEKEICFFDDKLKSGSAFHYLDFADMLEKTEIMIFTIELPSRYYGQLDRLNGKVKIFIPKSLTKTISILKVKGFGKCLVLL
ncbi:MAG: hypothetical protein J6W17_06430 [Campylobacter sp.]|nr:hypothetical protein [Campylobacter sp.]